MITHQRNHLPHDVCVVCHTKLLDDHNAERIDACHHDIIRESGCVKNMTWL